MSKPATEYPAPTAPDHPAFAPPPVRRVPPWIIAVGALAAVLMVLGAVTAAVLTFVANTGATVMDAQRDCRTAFGREFADRQARLDTGSRGVAVLTTMTSIDVEESRETDTGFEVNGVVRYDLSAIRVPTVHGSLNLTCEARERNGTLVTTVRNRV